jgi:hypothetical protein
MRNTRYRQPAWYRYVAGFAAGKPVIVAENPYGGVVPDLIQMLKAGRGYDLFRMSLYEAAALGANMSVPYGAWMGSIIQDSFHPPHELCVEIQKFIADHEQLYSHTTYSDTAVIYSVETEFLRTSGRGIFADNRSNTGSSEVGPFWQACEALSNAAQPYDVLLFPDGSLRADSLTLEDVSQYHTLILPDCRYLTSTQSQLLVNFLNRDGHLLVMGELGANLPTTERGTILEHPNTHLVEDVDRFDLAWLPLGQQVRYTSRADIAVNLQRVDSGLAIHLLRYDFSFEEDRVPALDELNLEIHLPGVFSTLEVFSPGEPPQARLEVSEDMHRIILKNVSLYSILLLKE